MVWTSEDYFWKPAVLNSQVYKNIHFKGVNDCSLRLCVNDGYKCRIEMDDCCAENYHDCGKCCDGLLNDHYDHQVRNSNDSNCGYKESAATKLSLEDLIGLRAGIDQAIFEIGEHYFHWFKYYRLNLLEPTRREKIKELCYGKEKEAKTNQ